MKDEELSTLLRRLPRAVPSPTFTTVVLQRLERHATAPWWRQPALLAIAAAGLLLVLAGVFVVVAPERRASGSPADVAASRERVDRLRTEYEQLEQELQELRLLAAESQPVVGVEGEDGVDYLFDLRELASSADRARVTSFRTDY